MRRYCSSLILACFLINVGLVASFSVSLACSMILVVGLRVTVARTEALVICVMCTCRGEWKKWSSAEWLPLWKGTGLEKRLVRLLIRVTVIFGIVRFSVCGC